VAVAAKLYERVSSNQFRCTWTLVAAGDNGDPLKVPLNARVVVQIVSGTAGAGTTFFFEGTNDSVAGAVATPPGVTTTPWASETAGTTFATVEDDDATGITGTVGAGAFTVPSTPISTARLPLWVQPRMSGGNAANIKVIALVDTRAGSP
jgi:hypothetical protein